MRATRFCGSGEGTFGPWEKVYGPEWNDPGEYGQGGMVQGTWSAGYSPGATVLGYDNEVVWSREG